VRSTLVRLALVGGAVVALDQWTKHWATHALAFRPPVEVLGTLVRLTYTRNSGVAFGIGAGTGFPYYVFSIVAAIIILWLLLRGRVADTPRQWALSLVFGGAIGNLIDRVGSGEVVDFILLSWKRWSFPVFNLADTAVTTGVLLFALTAGRAARPADPDGAAVSAGDVAATSAVEEPRGADENAPRPADRIG
jgi:signal peptidase II